MARRLLRGVAGGGLVLLFVAALAVLGGAGWARTEAGRAWLRDRLVALVAPAHGTLTVGALETDLYSTVTLRDVRLARADGVEIGRVGTLALRYRLGGLVARRLVVPEARAEGVALTLTRTDAGLDLAALWDTGAPPSDAPWRGLPIDLSLPDVAITDATVTWNEPGRAYAVHALDVRGAVALEGPAVVVRGLRLAADATAPDLGALALGGDVRWDPHTLWVEDLTVSLGPNRLAADGGLGDLGGDARVGVGVSALHVEPASLAPLLGALPVTGAFDATGAVAGPLDAPTLLLELRTPGGPLHVNARLDRRGARPTWAAQLVPSDLDLHAFLPAAPEPTVLRGAVSLDGEGLSWPDDLAVDATVALDAPRVGAWTDLAARGALTLRDGVLGLDDLSARAPGVSARGDGAVRLLERTGELDLADAAADLGLLARFGLPEPSGAARFAGAVRFGWGDAPAVAVDGALRARDVGWAGVGTVGGASGPLVVSWSPGRAEVTGRLALQTVEGFGARAAVADVDGTVSVGEDLDVRAAVALGGVAAAGAEVGAATGAVTVTRRRGRLAAAVQLTTADVAWQGWRADTGAVRARLDGDTVGLRVDLADQGRPMLVLDGEADLAARAVRARELLVAPTPELAWRGEGIQTARFVEGGVADVRVRLTSDTAVVSVDGGAGRVGTVGLRVEARDVRIDRLAALAGGRFDGYAGRATLRASLDGPAARPGLALDLSAEGLALPGVARRLDLALQASGADGRLELDGDLSTRGARLARLRGALPVSLALADPRLLPDGALDLRLIVPPTATATWDGVRSGPPLPDARVSAEVAVTGPMRDPRLGVTAIVDAPVGRGGEWVRLDVDARTADGRLEIRAVARERLERRLELSGGVRTRFAEVAAALLGGGPAPDLGAPETWLGDLDVNVVPMRLPVEVLAAFVPGVPARLSGDLAGGVNAAGSLRAPRLQGALLLVGGRLGDLALSPAEVVVTGASGGYDVAARLGFGGRSAVTVAGYVPFDPIAGGALADELRRDGLDLRVRAADVPLSALAAAWPRLEAGAGTFALDGVVRGALLDPAPDLSFNLKDGDFFLVPTGVRYVGTRFSGRLTRDTLAVDDLFVETRRVAGGEGGTVTGRLGARRVKDRPVLEGKLALDRALLVDLPDTRLRMSGALQLADRAGKVRVGGRLIVDDGNLVVPERFFTGASDLALGPDVRVLRRGVAPPEVRATGAGAFGFPRWLDADVAVDLGGAAFLDASMPMEQVLGAAFRTFSSIQISTQLDGELAVRVEDGALSLVGEVRPLRGLARVFNRPFDLRGDTISFTGRDYTEPVLDLVAVYESAEDGPITTTITGTPSDLALDFTAEATLPKEDILGVLVTGNRLSELAAGQGAELSGLLTSVGVGLLDDLGTGARLFDVFEVDASHLRVGTRIRGGKWFDADLFVLGEADFSADPEEENPFEVTLEWRVSRRWQFDLTTGTAGFSSLAFNRKWRF